MNIDDFLVKTWAYLIILSGLGQLKRPKVFHLEPGSIIVPGLAGTSTNFNGHFLYFLSHPWCQMPMPTFWSTAGVGNSRLKTLRLSTVQI